MTRDEGANRFHPKWKKLWKNILEEKDLRAVVNLRPIETLIKKEVPNQKDNQKSGRIDIDLKVKKKKKKMKERKKKHWRYSSSPSPPSSSNDDSEESKFRNNEGKESIDSRFRVISDEDQYKYSFPPDMV